MIIVIKSRAFFSPDTSSMIFSILQFTRYSCSGRSYNEYTANKNSPFTFLSLCYRKSLNEMTFLQTNGKQLDSGLGILLFHRIETD